MFPARIHALLASDAPVGVVFRRGPSKHVCTFLWNRTIDRFELGQWFKGRIYERRSDISPDGKFMIYFAMNGKWESETLGSWTAISRTPWLKAIELHAKGDCWGGGGLFLSNNSYWLNDTDFGSHETLIKSKEISREKEYSPSGARVAEFAAIHEVRLQRDGWKLIVHYERPVNAISQIFEKSLRDDWVLRKIVRQGTGSSPGKGCSWDDHELENKNGNKKQFPTWEWADLDGNRLVWAERGCLYQSTLPDAETLGKGQLLCDFNEFRFKTIEAPY